MPFTSSFRDAQGNAMVIEGQITGVPLTLGKVTIYPTLIIYEAKHCEALLGWDLLVDQKWAVDQEGIWCKYSATQPESNKTQILFKIPAFLLENLNS